jgi:DNA-binding transcriptional LysR family regulator
MGIHHSALSRRIRDLERSLGTALFERQTCGVRPTEAGMGLLRNLRRVLADLDGTLAFADIDRRGQAGGLSVDSDASEYAIAFLHAVAEFIRSRPDVALSFMEAKRSAGRLS